MKLIELSNFRIDFQVDDEDYERINQFKWTGSFRSNKIGSINRSKWDTKTKTKSTIPLANEILQIQGIIDHKDRNALNNQKLNLRPCNQQQNTVNTGSGFNVSGYRGVSANKRNWTAKISFNGERKTKTFSSKLEAAQWYDEQAIKYWGEFAVLNFPENSSIVLAVNQITTSNLKGNKNAHSHTRTYQISGTDGIRLDQNEAR